MTTFKVGDGELVAVGLLSGGPRDASGDLIGRVENERVVMPTIVAAAKTTCDILKLRLGPLDLDLLGLQVHLDRIVLDITAVAGPGNLLGNLLCAIAHLLDPGIDLDRALAAILRAILEILGCPDRRSLSAFPWPCWPDGRATKGRAWRPPLRLVPGPRYRHHP